MQHKHQLTVFFLIAVLLIHVASTSTKQPQLRRSSKSALAPHHSESSHSKVLMKEAHFAPAKHGTVNKKKKILQSLGLAKSIQPVQPVEPVQINESVKLKVNVSSLYTIILSRPRTGLKVIGVSSDSVHFLRYTTACSSKMHRHQKFVVTTIPSWMRKTGWVEGIRTVGKKDAHANSVLRSALFSDSSHRKNSNHLKTNAGIHLKTSAGIHLKTSAGIITK